MKLYVSLAVIALGLAGCSVMPKQPEPSQLYVLPPPAFQKPEGAVIKPVTIKIALPEVAAGLDTLRIAVLENGYKLNYFAQANWPEPLPYMLQTRLVDGFGKSGVVRGVSSDVSGVQSDYILQMDVQEFNTVNDGGMNAPMRVRVRYKAMLMATASRALVASVPAEQEITATATTMEAIIAAFNTADADVMSVILPRLVAALPLNQKETVSK